jgi:hypothetical protein
MGERDDARRDIALKRDRMSAIAHEMSRRMTPEYAKERASEMAREKAYEVRERATDSSWFLPLIGAGIGALLGKTLASRAQGHRDDDWRRYEYRHLGAGYRGRYDHGYEGYGSEGQRYDERYAYVGGEGIEGSSTGGESTTGRMGERASEMKDRMSEGASHVKERMADGASQVRERVAGMAGEYRDRASSLRERLPDREELRSRASEDEGLWALGAMALGAAFGLAIPMSSRERELLEPARRKVREAGQQAKDAALEKGTEAMDTASSRLDQERGGEEERSRTGASSSGVIITPPSQSPPLH